MHKRSVSMLRKDEPTQIVKKLNLLSLDTVSSIRILCHGRGSTDIINNHFC